jgi:hypothetical protein
MKNKMNENTMEVFLLNAASVSAVGVHISFTDVITSIGVLALAFYNIMKGISYINKNKKAKDESRAD